MDDAPLLVDFRNRIQEAGERYGLELPYDLASTVITGLCVGSSLLYTFDSSTAGQSLHPSDIMKVVPLIVGVRTSMLSVNLETTGDELLRALLSNPSSAPSYSRTKDLGRSRHPRMPSHSRRYKTHNIHKQQWNSEIEKDLEVCNVLVLENLHQASSQLQSLLTEINTCRSFVITEDESSHSFSLPETFMLIATADGHQLDNLHLSVRDQFCLCVGLPAALATTLPPIPLTFKPAYTPTDIRQMGSELASAFVILDMAQYMREVVYALRSSAAVAFGPGPRGASFLQSTVRARCLLGQRAYATPDDVVTVAADVLAHRIDFAPLSASSDDWFGEMHVPVAQRRVFVHSILRDIPPPV